MADEIKSGPGVAAEVQSPTAIPDGERRVSPEEMTDKERGAWLEGKQPTRKASESKAPDRREHEPSADRKISESMTRKEREEYLLSGKLPDQKESKPKGSQPAEKPSAASTDQNAQPDGATSELPAAPAKPETLDELAEGWDLARGTVKAWDAPEHQMAAASIGTQLAQKLPNLPDYKDIWAGAEKIAIPTAMMPFLGHVFAECKRPAQAYRQMVLNRDITTRMINDYMLSSGMKRIGVLSAIRAAILNAGNGTEQSSQANGSKSSTRRVTNAPAPPREIGGKASATEDPVKSAVARRDFSSFREAANASDIARRKKGR